MLRRIFFLFGIVFPKSTCYDISCVCSEVENTMDILRIILTIIYVIDCIALTVIVLMQEGKDAGLGAIAGAADTYWGQNKGRSMEGGLERLTRILVVIFFVLSLLLSMNFLSA